MPCKDALDVFTQFCLQCHIRTSLYGMSNVNTKAHLLELSLRDLCDYLSSNLLINASDGSVGRKKTPSTLHVDTLRFTAAFEAVLSV